MEETNVRNEAIAAFIKLGEKLKETNDFDELYGTMNHFLGHESFEAKISAIRIIP